MEKKSKNKINVGAWVSLPSDMLLLIQCSKLNFTSLHVGRKFICDGYVLPSYIYQFFFSFTFAFAFAIWQRVG